MIEGTFWWIDCFTHSLKSLFCFSFCDWKNYNVTPRSAMSFMVIKSVCTPNDLPACGLNKNRGVWTAVSAPVEPGMMSVTSGFMWWFKGQSSTNYKLYNNGNMKADVRCDGRMESPETWKMATPQNRPSKSRSTTWSPTYWQEWYSNKMTSALMNLSENINRSLKKWINVEVN